MHWSRIFRVLPCLIVLATGCSSPAKPTQGLNQVVQATFAAMTAQAGQPPASPAADTGSISGTLNYPADSLPPMHVVAFRVGTQGYQFVTTAAGQGGYKIDNLPAGTYHVVAYTIGGGSFPSELAGGYTQVVPCGMTAECTDHSLIDVIVGAGQDVQNIRPADWYAPEGSFPPFPQ